MDVVLVLSLFTLAVLLTVICEDCVRYFCNFPQTNLALSCSTEHQIEIIRVYDLSSIYMY